MARDQLDLPPMPHVHSNGYVSPREHSPESQARARGQRPITGVQLEKDRETARQVALAHSASLNGMVAEGQHSTKYRRVGLRDRIGCYQWTYFTMTMATGGVANALCSIPFQHEWLTIIGLVFFFFNIFLFIVNCVMITLRFHLRPGSFRASLSDQSEALFVPSFFVSIAVIIVTITEYGVPHAGPWLVRVSEALFWIYSGTSIIVSATMYLILWSTLVFPIHTMTPVWVFPAYPLLLNAPMAATLLSAALNSGKLHMLNCLAVALCSLTVQGTGYLISFMISAAFLYRLMTQKLPRDSQRPGVFISIGPSGFTVAGVVGLANLAPDILPPNFMGIENAAAILKIQAVMSGLWLWGLSVWFFLVSVGSLFKYVKRKHMMPFQMNWFSFVFPNTALVTATLQLGKALDCYALEVAGCVMTGALILVWLIVFVCMLRCLWARRLLWPKDVS